MKKNKLIFVIVVICALIVTTTNAEPKRKKSNRVSATAKRKETQADAPLPEYGEDYEYSEDEDGANGGRFHI